MNQYVITCVAMKNLQLHYLGNTQVIFFFDTSVQHNKCLHELENNNILIT